MSSKINVGVLGATGTVGQKFIQLLQNHPWFEIHALGASERSVGKPYEHVVHWLQTDPIPQTVGEMILLECSPTGSFSECKLVFSALDAVVAGPIEESFSNHGIAVFSNAKNFRHSPLVPLLVPHVNPDHIQSVALQMKEKGNNGFIVTNPNCSTTGLVVPLKAIDNKYGIEEAVVFTMQAVSGAGYPGVSSMDIFDNVIPFIDGEEPKIEKETRKILGTVNIEKGKEVFTDKKIKISSHTNRVAVLDGHTICVSLRLVNKATPSDIKQTLKEYTSEAQILGLPSAPIHPIKVIDAPNRPQPRLDRNEGNGFTVSVGRVRPGQDSECTSEIESSSFDIRLTLLVHNTILGAAGGSIINAELAKAKGFI